MSSTADAAVSSMGILKSEGIFQKKAKKTVHFEDGSVDRAQFRHYTRYFILNSALENIKATVTTPGFYFYFDDEQKLCVLVMHGKGVYETIRFSEMTQIEENNAFIEKLTKNLSQVDVDLRLRKKEKEEITLPDEIKPLDTSNLKTIRLIMSNCENIPHTYSRKTLQVINFSRIDKLKHFINATFAERSIAELDAMDKDYFVQPDVYIVFFDGQTPKEITDHLAKISDSEQSGFKIIWIMATKNGSVEKYNNQIINEIYSSYSIYEEDIDPKLINLKKTLLSAAKSKIFPDEAALEVTFSDLIKLYTVINARPQLILGYYESYEASLKEIEEKCSKEHKELFKKSFRSFDECAQKEAELYKAKDEAKKDQLDILVERIEKHYPSHYGRLPHVLTNMEQLQQHMFFYTESLIEKESEKTEEQTETFASHKR